MLQDTVRNGVKAVSDVSRDDILYALGLERRRTPIEMALPVIGFFAAGLVVGTGITMLFTPKTGRDMRENIKSKARDLSHKAEGVAEDVRGALPFLGEKAKEVAEKVETGVEHMTHGIGSAAGSSATRTGATPHTYGK